MSPATRRRWRSRILDVGVRTTFHTICALALYLLFAGHNRPGGGFAGGLVAGAAFVLVFVAGGSDAVDDLMGPRPEALLGAGLLLASGTALLPLFASGTLLESGKWALDLPLFGDVSVYSVLAFDTGVFLVVVGMVTLVLDRLGREDPS